jgi:hypothetical protein
MASDNEARLMILSIYQEGLAPVDVTELMIDQIKLTEDSEFIPVEIERSKTNETTILVLNPEWINEYKQYLKRRENPKSGYVLINRNGNKFDERDISLRIKEAARIALTEEDFKNFRAYSLRHAYNESILTVSPAIAQEKKDALMGHTRQGARRNYSLGELVEDYKRVFRLISIDGQQKELFQKEEFQELKNNVGSLIDLVKIQQKQIEEMNIKLNEAESFIDAVLTDPELAEPYPEHIRETLVKMAQRAKSDQK